MGEVFWKKMVELCYQVSICYVLSNTEIENTEMGSVSSVSFGVMVAGHLDILNDVQQSFTLLPILSAV